MHTMKIAMLVRNTMVNDARVEKEAAALARNGHEVVVFALKGKDLQEVEEKNGFEIRRIQLPRPRRLFSTLRFLIALPGRIFRRSRRFVGDSRRFLRSQLGIPEPVDEKNLTKKSLNPVKFSKLKAFVPSWVKSVRAKLRHQVSAYRYGWAYSKAIKPHLELYDPDVIHVHDLNAAFGIEKTAKSLGCAYVYDSHELWLHRNLGPYGPYLGPIKLLESRIESRVMKNAYDSITVCQSIAEHLSDYHGVGAPKVIRNVPLRKNDISRGKAFRQETLGLDNDKVLLSYSGKATYNRGLEEVVAALAILPEKFHLLLLGGFAPEFKVFLDKEIQRLGLADRVHKHGPVASDDVSVHLSGADIGLVPIIGDGCLSYHYCLPNKLFEAIQAGLPVLGSDLPEIKRTIENYQCGEVVQSMDAQKLAAQIEKLAGNASLLENYRAGSARAAKELVWEEEADNLLSIYDRLEGSAPSETGATR